jgi:hypothetical protein
VDFLGDDGFVRGLLLSAAFAVPAAVVLLARSRRPGNGVPVGGALAVAAGLLALTTTGLVGAGVVVGTLLAGAGSLVATAASFPAPVRCALVAPGAAVAATAVDAAEGWMVVMAIATVALAGPAADAVDDRFKRTGLGVVMLCMSTAGVFVTIPETDAVIVVLGAMVPVGLLAVPRALVSLGPGGATAVLTLLAAITLEGGQTRPGAVVGGLLAPGLLALLALLPAPPTAAVATSWPPLARRLAVLQVVLVLGVTRVAGLLEAAAPAAVLAAAFSGLAWLAARLLVTRAMTDPTEAD